MVKFSPLHDYVLVERVKEQESSRGIVIPEGAREKPQEGRVVSSGPGEFKDGQIVPIGIKPGDRVLFGKYAGVEIVIEGQDYLILRESDILGILGSRTTG